MGTEYHLSCPSECLPDIATLLHRAGGLPCPQHPEQIEFRFRLCKLDDMPDVTVKIESAGIYFLDNGAIAKKSPTCFFNSSTAPLIPPKSSYHPLLIHNHIRNALTKHGKDRSAHDLFRNSNGSQTLVPTGLLSTFSHCPPPAFLIEPAHP
jgi:hypothetical protein